jgi:lipid II isoglutaminyl synthase (glutamine-hydrolysing)
VTARDTAPITPVGEAQEPQRGEAIRQDGARPAGRPVASGVRATRLTPRLFTSLVAGKLIAHASRTLQAGGGTSLPGVIAEKVMPDVLAQVGARVRGRTVLVAGSNGKTTTARFAAALLRGEGESVVTNSSGANLLQGVTSTLIAAADLRGRVGATSLVIEVDEGALPRVAADLAPDVLVATDLFRDQLDRFGEIYAVAALFQAVVDALPQESAWVFNADDPLVSSLELGPGRRRIAFGLDLDRSTDELSSAADTIRCPRCRSDLAFDAVYLSHLGRYRCPACGFERPALDVAVTSIEADAIDHVELTVRTPWGELGLSIPQGGTHIAYDVAAAIAALAALDVEPTRAEATLAAVTPAFGRLERIDNAGVPVYLAFVKNPTSANTTLQTLAVHNEPRRLLMAASNTPVDGEDFGWLWDVDFESAAPRVKDAVVSGTRADELGNRLKYAGVDASRIRVIEDRRDALDAALGGATNDEPLVILAGYTPTIELREEMRRRGWVGKYWET